MEWARRYVSVPSSSGSVVQIPDGGLTWCEYRGLLPLLLLLLLRANLILLLLQQQCCCCLLLLFVIVCRMAKFVVVSSNLPPV